MAKQRASLSLDEELLPIIEEDMGQATLSAHVNYILKILYSREMPMALELETYRRRMGLRDIPEAVRHLLQTALDRELRRMGEK